MENILINAFSAKLGGGKTYILNLLRNLPMGEIKIYILCSDITLLPDDSRVVFVDSKLAYRGIFCRMFWEFFYLPFLLIKLRISVLFVPGGMDFTFVTFGVPKVTMFRNMLPFDKVAISNLPTTKLKVKNFLLKYLMIRTMVTADHVIFISNYAKRELEKEIEIKSSSVIYHGISEVFKPVHDFSNYNGGEYLLYVSRFEPYKNHFNLIVAYSKLSQSFRSRYKLVIAGEIVEPYYSECTNFVEINHLAESVIFKGKVSYDKLPELYQFASLFIFPSSCENCPNIVLEAIGCGVPVIASKTDPMPEFVSGAGFYFDEKSPEDIHSCLVNVLSDVNLLNDMRIRSISLRNNYSWKETAFKTWKCLKEFGDRYVQK